MSQVEGGRYTVHSGGTDYPAYARRVDQSHAEVVWRQPSGSERPASCEYDYCTHRGGWDTFVKLIVIAGLVGVGLVCLGVIG